MRVPQRWRSFVSPRVAVALAFGVALAAVLGFAGPLVSLGTSHPLSEISTRVALILLVLWGAGLWAARRSLAGPMTGLVCLLIVQMGAEFAWGDARPLRSPWLRTLLAACVGLIYLSWLGLRACRRDESAQDLRQLVQAMRRLLLGARDAGPSGVARSTSEQQLRAAQQRWQLLHARPGWRGRLDARRARRSLPWYLVLGDPGSGKSSLLAASSLRLLRNDADDHVCSMSGASTCWLGERAIFVESPGGAVAPPAQEAGQAQGPPAGCIPDDPWPALLQALRGRAARLRLRGIVLALDIGLLLRGGPECVAESVAATRRRLLELRATLGTSIPVYLVLNKSDGLAGFDEFFDAAEAHARLQCAETLCGFLLPARDAGQAMRDIKTELEWLRQRFEQVLPACLEQELSLQRRCRLYELPHAFAELSARLLIWLDALLAPWPDAPAAGARKSQHDAATIHVRGVFLGSCACRDVAQSLPVHSGRFVAGLFGRVMLTDSFEGIGGDLRRGRKRIRQGFALALSLLVAAGGLQILARSQMKTREQLQILQGSVAELQARTDAALRRNAVGAPWDAVLRAAQQLADDLRHMPAAWPLGGWALDPLRDAARVLVVRLQQALLMPRFASTMRNELDRAMQGNDMPSAFSTLKAYLMLHDPSLYDAGFLRAWAHRHEAGERTELALEDTQGPLRDPTPFDQALVQRAREWLLRRGRPQRLWWIVRDQLPSDQEPATFSLAAWQGRRSERPFLLASGEPLTHGVPGWYRPQAWSEVLAPHLQEWAAGAGEEDRRVVGDGAGVAAAQVLAEELRHEYWMEYARHWAAFLGDIRPQAMPEAQGQLQLLQSMAAMTSPLLDLGRVVWGELQPLEDSRIEQSDPVTMHLLELRVLGAKGGDPAVVQRWQGWLDAYYTAASLAATAIRAGKPPGVEFEQATARLRAQAGTMPAPLGAVAQGLGDDTTKLLLGAGSEVAQGQAGQRYAQIVGAFREQVALPCARTLGGRFPFRSSGTDADIEDFRTFFAPGGSADTYFRSYLSPWVDTSRRPWRYRSASAQSPAVETEPGQEAGAATDAVARELVGMLRRRGPNPEAFARIAQLRSALWRNGAGPAWDFDISVPEMDPRVTMLRLEIDGQHMRYAHGPVLPWHATWPGSRPASAHARLRLEGAMGPDAVEVQAQGPWAWMHLLAQGRRQRRSLEGGVDLAFGADGSGVVLHLGGPEPNPWSLGVLEGFQCPR